MLIAKLLVVPAANLGVVLAALRLGLLPPAGSNPLLPVVLLIVGGSPTAMNMSTISTLSGVGQREVATVLFWQYCLAGVTMSLWATVGLALFLPDGGGAGAEEIELGSGDL